MFLSDFNAANFARKKKGVLTTSPEEEKRKQTKDWNNWEKAREIRSGLSTGQRLSQDVRGWLNMAQRLRG